MRRMLLVANPNAHGVTPYAREVIAGALSSAFKLEELQTLYPGHAVQVARDAAQDGVDVVAVLGGDGTVNEVVNGIAGSPTALALIPGGLANVLARSLGIPNDPVEATGQLLENAEAKPRRIPLGRIDGRYFAANCGVGFDATIVKEVERRQRAKRRGGDWFFVRTGVRRFFRGYDRRTPRVHLAWGDRGEHRRDGLFLAVVQNVSPFTFLGNRGLRLCPDTLVDAGLDCFAMDSLRTTVAVSVDLRAFGSGRHVRSRHVLLVPDQRRIEIRCDLPLPVQADGEYLGERDRVLVEAVPGALSILY